MNVSVKYIVNVVWLSCMLFHLCWCVVCYRACMHACLIRCFTIGHTYIVAALGQNTIAAGCLYTYVPFVTAEVRILLVLF